MAVVGDASPRSKPATFLGALLPASLLEDIARGLVAAALSELGK
jgi:hypothetical protein